MARTLAKAGKGHQLRIGNAGSPESFTAISEGKMVKGPSVALDALEATHTDSDGGWKEYVAGNLSAGQLTWNGNYINDSVQAGVLTDLIAGTVRNFQVYAPTNTAKTFAVTALIVAFEPNFEVNGVIGLSLTLQPTGAVS